MKLHYFLADGYVSYNPGVPLEINDKRLEGLAEWEQTLEIAAQVEKDAARYLEWEEDT